VKIKLLNDKSIRGNLTKAGSTVDVGDLVAIVLIEDGDAEISDKEGKAAKTATKSKKTDKAED